MKGCRILLLLDSTTFKSLALRRTGLCFLGSCSPGYRGGIDLSFHSLTLLQLQSCLVPFISERIFIIPKLRNIHWGQFYAIYLSEPFSLCIECLPNCYSVRSCASYCPYIRSDWAFRGHISRALPTETIFNLLRSIPSDALIRDYSRILNLDTLKIIIMWLQVSVIECDRQTPQTKNLVCV